MKKHIFLLFIFLSVIILSFRAEAQKIITIAGNGTEGYLGDGGKAVSASLHWPMAVALDRKGNIYIADADNNVIRRINTSGIITTIAGTGLDAGSGFGAYGGDGGPATAAYLFFPSGIAIDTSGNIFIADTKNNCIRKIDTGGIINTVAGNGLAGFSGDGALATAAKLNQPSRIALDTFGNLYIADYQNNRIRKVDPSKKINTIAGTGVPNYTGDGGPAITATLNYPSDVAVDTFGNVYIADELNNCIRKIDVSGNISTFAGMGIPAYSGDGGPATAARLFDPVAIALDDSFNLYISDMGNSVIRKVNKKDTITTYAGVFDSTGYFGDGGPATAARIWFPQGLAVNKKGSLYISDQGNNRIRFIGSPIEAVIPVNPFPVNINIYPNPSRGAFMINITSDFYEQAQVVISNLAGEKISETTARTNVLKEIKTDAPPGIYFLSVISAHETWSGKLIIR